MTIRLPNKIAGPNAASRVSYEIDAVGRRIG
jgi:hypothetical protein